MKKMMLLFVFVCVFVGISQAQNYVPNYSYQAKAETLLVKPSLTILTGIVIDKVGTTDTIEIYDQSVSTPITQGQIVLRIPVNAFSSNRVIALPPDGVVLGNGFLLRLAGTVGAYTFLYR